MLTSGYISLFFTSFIAATIFPLSSEAVLAGLLSVEGAEFWVLVGLATFGNVLGSVVNWAIGGWCLRYQDHKYFPISRKTLNRAVERFNQWGLWVLLFAWLPIIGDPITFAAGALRTSFFPFIILVTIGKGVRYLIVAAGVQQFIF